MEPSTEAPTTEMIRAAQKAVGEVLWLTTRARPDIMFTVARMGSSVTKAPEAVLKASIQLKGCLKATSNEGLIFKVGENEHPVLTVFTDASFAPDSQESHGSFIVMLGATPIFWWSGRQGFVTLSTAEAELTEIVEGMIAGESIFVILAELFPKISKLQLSFSFLSSFVDLYAAGRRHVDMQTTLVCAYDSVQYAIFSFVGYDVLCVSLEPLGGENR